MWCSLYCNQVGINVILSSMPIIPQKISWNSKKANVPFCCTKSAHFQCLLIRLLTFFFLALKEREMMSISHIYGLGRYNLPRPSKWVMKEFLTASYIRCVCVTADAMNPGHGHCVYSPGRRAGNRSDRASLLKAGLRQSACWRAQHVCGDVKLN